MAISFALISTEIGKESQVMKALINIENDTEVNAVYGTYDIVLKQEVDDRDGLKTIVSDKIRRTEGIRSSITLIAS